MKKIVSKFICIMLAICFILPGNIFAAMPDIVEPKESAYLAGYSAYCYGAGGGRVQVCYDVTGTHTMEDIGALSIELYESIDGSNWNWVESFTNRQIPSMLGHNTNYFANYVTYQGVSGRFYKAKVCVWAGRNGGGDRRYFWTATERAI